MKRLNVSLVVYVLLVFASGVLVGTLGQRFYQSRTVSAQGNRSGLSRAEEFRRKLLSEMHSRLGLRAEQEQQVNVVLDATRDRVHALQQRFEPEMKEIHEEQHAKIRAILDDRQKIEYNKMLEERERERRRKQPGH